MQRQLPRATRTQKDLVKIVPKSPNAIAPYLLLPTPFALSATILVFTHLLYLYRLVSRLGKSDECLCDRRAV